MLVTRGMRVRIFSADLSLVLLNAGVLLVLLAVALDSWAVNSVNVRDAFHNV